MSKNIKKLIDECNVKIVRLKSIIPGLQCTDELMTSRSQPHMIVGYVDEAWPLFYISSQTEGSGILVSRLLDSHIELMNRLCENIKALKKIVFEENYK